MKLITAIVNKEDSKNVCNELIKAKFYVTRLATTGGFLMAGNMTLLIGTEDERDLPLLQTAHRDRSRHRFHRCWAGNRYAHRGDRWRRNHFCDQRRTV